jgi:hypothetical protein
LRTADPSFMWAASPCRLGVLDEKICPDKIASSEGGVKRDL